jgi:hypothetical protein
MGSLFNPPSAPPVPPAPPPPPDAASLESQGMAAAQGSRMLMMMGYKGAFKAGPRGEGAVSPTGDIQAAPNTSADPTKDPGYRGAGNEQNTVAPKDRTYGASPFTPQQISNASGGLLPVVNQTLYPNNTPKLNPDGTLTFPPKITPAPPRGTVVPKAVVPRTAADLELLKAKLYARGKIQ